MAKWLPARVVPSLWQELDQMEEALVPCGHHAAYACTSSCGCALVCDGPTIWEYRLEHAIILRSGKMVLRPYTDEDYARHSLEL